MNFLPPRLYQRTNDITIPLLSLEKSSRSDVQNKMLSNNRNRSGKGDADKDSDEKKDFESKEKEENDSSDDDDEEKAVTEMDEDVDIKKDEVKQQPQETVVEDVEEKVFQKDIL